MSFGATTTLRAGLNPLLPGLLGIVALTATSCGGKISRDTGAEILAVDGKASISSQAISQPRPATSGAVLAEGESLQTGAASSASLLLLPGALVHLGPESAIGIKQLVVTKNGNATDEAMSRLIRLELRAGTADFVVQFEPTADAWSVSTDFGAITTLTRGGTCRIETEPKGVRLTVLRGQFTFKSAVAETDVEAGFAGEFPAGSAPHPVETQERTQADVEQILQVEQDLLKWERMKRKTAFPWREL